MQFGAFVYLFIQFFPWRTKHEKPDTRRELGRFDTLRLNLRKPASGLMKDLEPANDPHMIFDLQLCR